MRHLATIVLFLSLAAPAMSVAALKPEAIARARELKLLEEAQLQARALSAAESRGRAEEAIQLQAGLEVALQRLLQSYHSIQDSVRSGDRSSQSVIADLAEAFLSPSNGVTGTDSALLGSDSESMAFARNRARHLLEYLTEQYLTLASQTPYRSAAAPAPSGHTRNVPTLEALRALLQVAPIALAEAVLSKDGGQDEPAASKWHQRLLLTTKLIPAATALTLIGSVCFGIPAYIINHYPPHLLPMLGVAGSFAAGIIGSIIVIENRGRIISQAQLRLQRALESGAEARQAARSEATKARIAAGLNEEMLSLEFVVDKYVFERLGDGPGRALLKNLWDGCEDALAPAIQVRVEVPAEDAGDTASEARSAPSRRTR